MEMATTGKNSTGGSGSSSKGYTARSDRTRKKPGAGGQGQYYHIEVRSDDDFTTYRTQDVGEPGRVQRVAGKRATGSWATVKWLIDKQDAHVSGDTLVGDTQDAREVIAKLRTRPVHIGGDRFQAEPRRNVPERSKPTAAQQHARRTNIKKAQTARRKRG
jgi:hypothetical protein